MDTQEIVERLERIADHTVHIAGGRPFIMSLDDGIAIHEAINAVKQIAEIKEVISGRLYSLVEEDVFKYKAICDVLREENV